MLRIIGDLHGNFPVYHEVIKCPHETLQLGDMGIGFGEDYKFHPNLKSSWFNGNHDDYQKCKTMPGFIEKPCKINDKVFVCGGGFSIDYQWRTPGIDWWEDEEFSFAELQEAIEAYKLAKPEVMVSHEAPAFMAKYMVQGQSVFKPSRTACALEAMWEAHRPKYWFYGHWHLDFRLPVSMPHEGELETTNFICVPIDSYVDIDLDTMEVSKTTRVKLGYTPIEWR